MKGYKGKHYKKTKHFKSFKLPGYWMHDLQLSWHWHGSKQEPGPQPLDLLSTIMHALLLGGKHRFKM